MWKTLPVLWKERKDMRRVSHKSICIGTDNLSSQHRTKQAYLTTAQVKNLRKVVSMPTKNSSINHGNSHSVSGARLQCCGVHHSLERINSRQSGADIGNQALWFHRKQRIKRSLLPFLLEHRTNFLPDRHEAGFGRELLCQCVQREGNIALDADDERVMVIDFCRNRGGMPVQFAHVPRLNLHQRRGNGRSGGKGARINDAYPATFGLDRCLLQQPIAEGCLPGKAGYPVGGQRTRYWGAFTTLLAKDTKSAMQQGDRKGSPLLYTNGAACQARL
jgi:hypothetical protein